MAIHHAKLVSGGRIQVPADVRRALGLNDGDSVTLEVIDGELHVRPWSETLARVRKALRQYVPPGVSLADELIAERRAEAARE